MLKQINAQQAVLVVNQRCQLQPRGSTHRLLVDRLEKHLHGHLMQIQLLQHDAAQVEPVTVQLLVFIVALQNGRAPRGL